MSQLSRRQKRGIFVLLAVGAIPLGIAGYLSFLNIEPDIPLPPRLTLPAPNGFDFYVQAAALTAQPNPPVDFATDPNSSNISAAAGAIRYGIARREAWHKAATPGWAKFKAAQRADSYAPDNVYDAKALTNYGHLRQLARDKNAETRLFAMRGANDEAMDSALDCVEMGFDVAHGGGLIPRLVCAAIVAVGLSPASESDAKGQQLPEQLSGPQARAAAARLENLMKNYPSWDAALRRGRIEALAELKHGFERDNWRASDAFFADYSAQNEGVVQRSQRNFISKRAVVANLNRAYADAIATQKQPYAPQIPGASGTAEASDKYDLISAALAPRENLRFNAARENTHLGLLLLRLALQTYRADKGAYPPNLAALKNGYLKQIPTDDFNGGKPYFYTVKGGKYRLWSVGPDAKNDGGKAIVPRFRGRSKLPWQQNLPAMMPDSTGDVVAGETR